MLQQLCFKKPVIQANMRTVGAMFSDLSIIMIIVINYYFKRRLPITYSCRCGFQESLLGNKSLKYGYSSAK